MRLACSLKRRLHYSHDLLENAKTLSEPYSGCGVTDTKPAENRPCTDNRKASAAMRDLGHDVEKMKSDNSESHMVENRPVIAFLGFVIISHQQTECGYVGRIRTPPA